MYSSSARLYDRMMSFYDWQGRYKKRLAAIRTLMQDAGSFLDCGCGTGRYLELFAQEFDCTGFDIDPVMVEQCRARSPGSKVLVADMVEFDLGRQFDVVGCLFRSIGYVQTVPRMHSAVASMARHLASGGLFLLEPFFTPEQLWAGHLTLNTVEDEQGKIAWMYAAKRIGNLCQWDIHYLVGNSEGVEHLTERHLLGLFTAADYETALADAGLEILDRPERPADGVYLCRKS